LGNCHPRPRFNDRGFIRDYDYFLCKKGEVVGSRVKVSNWHS
jgi:hypothetical protein